MRRPRLHKASALILDNYAGVASDTERAAEAQQGLAEHAAGRAAAVPGRGQPGAQQVQVEGGSGGGGFVAAYRGHDAVAAGQLYGRGRRGDQRGAEGRAWQRE